MNPKFWVFKIGTWNGRLCFNPICFGLVSYGRKWFCFWTFYRLQYGELLIFSHFFGPKMFQNEFMMNFINLAWKLTKLGISRGNFGIFVKVGVFREKYSFEYSNGVLKFFQCVEMSFGQIDHNSENVSGFRPNTSFNVLNRVLWCSSILIGWWNF